MKSTRYMLLLALVASPHILKAPPVPTATTTPLAEVIKYGQISGSRDKDEVDTSLPLMIWKNVAPGFKVAVKPGYDGYDVTYEDDREGLIEHRRTKLYMARTKGTAAEKARAKALVTQYVYDIIWMLKKGDQRVPNMATKYPAMTNVRPAGYGFIIDPKTHGQAVFDDSTVGKNTTTPTRDFLREAIALGFAKPTSTKPSPAWKAIKELLTISQMKKLEDMFTVAGKINSAIQAEIRNWYTQFGLAAAKDFIEVKFSTPKLSRYTFKIWSKHAFTSTPWISRAFSAANFKSDYTQSMIEDRLTARLTLGNFMQSVATLIHILMLKGINPFCGEVYIEFFEKAAKIMADNNLNPLTSDQGLAIKEALNKARVNTKNPSEGSGKLRKNVAIKLHEWYEVASYTNKAKAADKQRVYDLYALFGVLVRDKVVSAPEAPGMVLNVTYGGHTFERNAQGTDFADEVVKADPNDMRSSYIQKRIEGLNLSNVGRRVLEVGKFAQMPDVPLGEGIPGARNTDDFAKFFNTATNLELTPAVKALVVKGARMCGVAYEAGKPVDKELFKSALDKLGLKATTAIVNQ